MKSAVTVKNLTKTYGKITAVDNVSFDVRENEIFALIGPNGAGKSTILRILATVLSPSDGSGSVYGHDILKDAAAVRQIITYLPEEAGAYKRMTGLEYLKFMAALLTDNEETRKQYVDYACATTELGGRLKDKTGTYSKGMTRKLLLARAVMSKPKLAILDEPTSGLDVTNALYIRNLIKGLAKEGMAVLLSSHNMLEIEYLSDRVGIIDNGKIIETGTASELKKKYRAANLEEVFAKITK